MYLQIPEFLTICKYYPESDNLEVVKRVLLQISLHFSGSLNVSTGFEASRISLTVSQSVLASFFCLSCNEFGILKFG